MVGESSAGHPPERDIGPGQAMKIMTGALLPRGYPPHTRFVFDKQAHASMQFLKPIIAAEAKQLAVIEHNDLGALEAHAKDAAAHGETVVYVPTGCTRWAGWLRCRR